LVRASRAEYGIVDLDLREVAVGLVVAGETRLAHRFDQERISHG
jgi:hypothetical protein